MQSTRFPEGFRWGAAAASYQIEGAASEDGRGPSVWDVFTHDPGRVWRDQHGDVACDHYHRCGEDLDLMAELGLGAYRFSVSWSRVMPSGVGSVNQAGVDFYERLVDGLLQRGIEPWLTLFHWDYPLALQHRGGWLNRDSASWFADYAALITERFSDRVRHFMTLNEPQVFLGLGHHTGQHAPGVKWPWSEVLLAAHHVLLAHGMGVQAIRAAAKQPLSVGWAAVGFPRLPWDESPAQIDAARRATFAVDKVSTWNTAWWTDPVYLGRYPEDGLALYGRDVPRFPAADLELIRQPLDFFGINLYWGDRVRLGEDGQTALLPHPQQTDWTAFDWPVLPACMYWGPRFFHERYGLPIVVTENGVSGRDWVALDGKVHDPYRVDYVARHLLALRRAAEEGVPLGGYFHWSVLDNFEWSDGYRHRFGLIHVDYDSGRRRIKDSGYWYRDVIRSHGASLAQLIEGGA